MFKVFVKALSAQVVSLGANTNGALYRSPGIISHFLFSVFAVICECEVHGAGGT